MRFVFALAVLLAAALPAQVRGCPYERAQTVPASWVAGPVVRCSNGLGITINGVNVQMPNNTCPVFVIITPTHEIAVPSDRPTRTSVLRVDPELTAFFACDADYFLFIYLGADCVLDRTVVSGAVNRLFTQSCEEQRDVVQ
jgi:hypothetical protein